MMPDLFSDGGDLVYQRDVNNSVGVRNIYPTASGPSTGQRATAMTPYATGAYSQAANTGNQSNDVAADDAPGGVFGKPLTWWAVFLVLLIALMYTAKRAGQGGEFSNIKLSVYNILTITLAAAVGIGFLKVVFARFPVPGLSQYVGAL